MNWIVIVLVVIFAAFYILAPLRRASVVARDNEYSLLEGDGERAQNALLQAELDFSLGKINDDEYRELQKRHALPTSANANIVSPDKFVDEDKAATDSDAAIEAEILIARARRKSEPAPHSSKTDDWTCAQCQRTMSAQDRFCASCGAARVAQLAQLTAL